MWLPVEPVDHPRHAQPGAEPPPGASGASGADIPEPQGESAGTVGRDTEGADEWLFVRGKESIRVTRDPAATTLLMFGPGSLQNSHEFDSAASLEAFRQSHEQRVLREGWVLLDVSDRRASAYPLS